MKISTLMLSTLAGLTLAGTALGQLGTGGTITAGNMVFTSGDSPTSITAAAGPTANLRSTGAAGTNHMFEMWWWYRIAGDTREFNLGNAASSVTIGSSILRMTFNQPNFSAVLQYQVVSTGADTGFLRSTLSITNTSGAPISISLFNYTDLDVNNTAGGDSAVQLGSNFMRVSDPATTYTLAYSGVGADAYQVAAFATVRGLLTNNVVDNLNNTGLPFGPGDFTGAFQFGGPNAAGAPGGITIEPGFTSSVIATVSITNVPTPGAAALIGLAGLAGLRRRR
ncbi:MAG: MYXO-CTERM sorting domain-containing protein [Phycisphaerales bacterium]